MNKLASTENVRRMERLTPEQIADNFDKFRSLLEKTGPRSENALKMVDTLAERLAVCPASSKKSYHNAFPGGLIDHSLRVLSIAHKLSKTMGWDLPKESLIVCCLFHDLGKVGDDVDDYYLPQDSDWHRDKLGEVYKYNKDMTYMTTTDRTLWLCQHFGVKLSKDEYLAIKLCDGQYVDENKSYKMKEPRLSDIVHIADYLATKEEKTQEEE